MHGVPNTYLQFTDFSKHTDRYEMIMMMIIMMVNDT